MADERVQRRLAAILAADVAGYSQLMGADEEGTLARLKGHRRDLTDPKINEYRGRIVKTTGDGFLAEFASVIDALHCAVEIQRGMAECNAKLHSEKRIEFRLGLNVGDIVIDADDIYGDGVNVAARLEALAEPGGVCVSGRVQEDARGKIDLAFEDLGEQRLKNIAWPVQVHRVRLDSVRASSQPVSPIHDKPSIAVLPFVNMSGDPEQEYFSDGITEDIITDLSKVSMLHVLSRNTTFTFKGKAVEIGQIAQRLKVGYVIEGSVRKAGGRVRITAQLIDAGKDSHVWAERYDRDLKDIFALQDEISQAIVAALKGKLLPEERKAIENRSTDDSKAYQLYLMGRHYYLKFGARNQEVAIRFGQRALEIDPNYGHAWALIAGCQHFLHRRRGSEDGGLAAAEKALSLDPTLAEAHAIKGRHLALIGCYDEALVAHEESLRLEPDSFDVQFYFGLTCMRFGRHEAAIEHLERAAQLNENDGWALLLAGTSYKALGRHDELKSAARRALERIEREIALRLDNANALVCGCCALAYLGEKERAMEWASRALIIEPDDAMDSFNLAGAFVQMDEPDQALDLLESCLRKAPPDDLAWITQDPDMLPLHDHPRYQALIAREEARLAAVRAKQVNKAG